MTENEFVRHIPCDNCGSSDANSLYSDGHTYCFVCHNVTDGDKPIHNNKMQGEVYLTGSAERLQKRNISEKTNRFYQIHFDGNELKFPYHDESGVLKGIKTKTKKKDFRYAGVSTNTLFGQHRFPTTGKRIVVTEGELDAASCYEAMPSWPMVSLPHGAASAKKDIQKQIPLFQGYEEVVLFFDNDEAGIKAAEEAATVLPPGKTKIARLEGYKAPSEALQADDSEAIRKAIWDAKPYRPDGIVEGKSLLNLVTTPTPPADHEYPFQGLNELLHGIRYQELVTITSGSGIGKSSFCRQIAAGLLDKGEKVGYLALEESNRRTALGLMSVAVGQALHLGEHEHSTLKNAYDSTIANWNLYLYDHFGSLSADTIYSRIEYMALGLDIKVIFLDHLSILLSGLDGDERRMIDQTMTNLRSLVERTGIKLFLVSHLRRAQGDKAIEDGHKVSIGMLRGSASISQLSDTVLALERDQQNPDDVSTLRVLKNRYSGETGVATTLKFDKSTCKYHETENPIFSAQTDF